jgi:hypothetical protein
MAIRLQDKANTIAPNGTYEFGDIKDNTGSNNGTAVNRINHADFHQFFAKMMDDSGISYNNLPDNTTNGYQYWLALKEEIKKYSGSYIDISSSITVDASISGGTLVARKYFNGTVMISYIGAFSSNISQNTNLLSNIPNCAPQVLQTITFSGSNRAVNNIYSVGTDIINYFSNINTLSGGTSSIAFYLEYKEI